MIGRSPRAIRWTSPARSARRITPSQSAMIPIRASAIVTAVFAPFVAVRYLLPLHPPFALLLYCGPSSRSRRIATFATLSVSLTVSILLAWTDFRWASLYPPIAAELQAKYPHRRVYFTGHWGWQWYAEQAGFLPWDVRYVPGDVPAGSLIVTAQRADPTPINPAFVGRIRLVEERIFPANPLRLTTWCFPAGAPICFRFYGGDFPHLPWGFTSEPTERFGVFEVGP